MALGRGKTAHDTRDRLLIFYPLWSLGQVRDLSSHWITWSLWTVGRGPLVAFLKLNPAGQPCQVLHIRKLLILQYCEVGTVIPTLQRKLGQVKCLPQ